MLVLRLNWFISNTRRKILFFVFDDIVLFETNENDNFMSRKNKEMSSPNFK